MITKAQRNMILVLVIMAITLTWIVINLKNQAETAQLYLNLTIVAILGYLFFGVGGKKLV